MNRLIDECEQRYGMSRRTVFDILRAYDNALVDNRLLEGEEEASHLSVVRNT